MGTYTAKTYRKHMKSYVCPHWKQNTLSQLHLKVNVKSI